MESASTPSSLNSWHSDEDTSEETSAEGWRRSTSVRTRLTQSGYITDANRLTALFVHLVNETTRLVMILDGKGDAAGMWELLHKAGRKIDAVWRSSESSRPMSWQQIGHTNNALTEARNFYMNEFMPSHSRNAEGVAPQGVGFSCTEWPLVTDRGELLRSNAGHFFPGSWDVRPIPQFGCAFVVKFAEHITHLGQCVNTMYKLSGGQMEDDDVRDVLGDALDILESMEPRDVRQLSLAARGLSAAQTAVSMASRDWNNSRVAYTQTSS